jgi:hypothetical protein
MLQVSVTRPGVAAWKDDAREVAGLRAGQVYAQLWLARRIDGMNCEGTDLDRLRGEWLGMVERWPVTHPMLLAKVLSMHSNLSPPRPEVTDRYVERALSACSSDPLYDGDDLQVMLGRGEAFALSFYGLGKENLELACAMFASAAARCAKRGSLAGEGINRYAACLLQTGSAYDRPTAAHPELVEIADCLAHAGATSFQALCLGTVADDARRHTGSASQDAAAIDAGLLEAIALSRRDGDWHELGRVSISMAYFLQSSLYRPGEGGARVAAAWAAAAEAFALAGEAQLQGECLSHQAAAHGDYLNLRERGQLVPLRRLAEACFATLDEPAAAGGTDGFNFSYERMDNLCSLGEYLGDSGDRAGAHALFAGLALQLQDYTTPWMLRLGHRVAVGLANVP